MKFHSHLNTAVKIVSAYHLQEPFAIYIKKFFKEDKKYGSKDRKQIAALCYHYFRLGKAIKDMPVEKRILLANFLMAHEPSPLVEFYDPAFNDIAGESVRKKLSLVEPPITTIDIFPFIHELSEGIDAEAFIDSFFQQPGVFVRIRPGYKESVLNKLKTAAITYELVSDSCITFPVNTRVQDVLDVDKEVVIQDLNSQEIAVFLRVALDMEPVTSVWDCCTGSGGKSIMAYDLNPTIDLTVSDKRESILANLKERFAKAGIVKYKSIVTDLSKGLPTPLPTFQFIIADVPCTGSGTWARSPEQLYFFKSKSIDDYNALQKKIVSHSIPQLKSGGYYLYITCSVFKKENEEMVKFMLEKFPLQLVKSALFTGYDLHADTLFAALFVAE